MGGFGGSGLGVGGLEVLQEVGLVEGLLLLTAIYQGEVELERVVLVGVRGDGLGGQNDFGLIENALVLNGFLIDLDDLRDVEERLLDPVLAGVVEVLIIDHGDCGFDEFFEE